MRVTSNVRSFNNEQGLPVTVLGAPDDVEVLIVEMGMRGFGEITRLCEVAAPTIGVVTAVAASHTERVGGIDGVAIAKRELVEALPADGTADPQRRRRPRRRDGERTPPPRSSRTDVAGIVRLSAIELDELARPIVPRRDAVGRRAGAARRQRARTWRATQPRRSLWPVRSTGSIDAAIEALASAAVSGMRMEVVHGSPAAR